MLFREIERVRSANSIDKIVVATSTDPSDDELAGECAKRKVAVFRGSLHDVLDRFYRAAQTVPAEHFVRVTGDCPLIDPEVMDQVVSFHLQGGYDYSSNTIEPTFPDGLDVEVMTSEALRRSWQEAKLPSEREHVTPYLYGNLGRFRIGSFKNAIDLSNHRWTVDDAQDLELVSRIYAALYPAKRDFGYRDVLELLGSHPGWSDLNRGTGRNEGYKRSLIKDDTHRVDNKRST